MTEDREKTRLAELRALKVLDTPPEVEFDCLASLATIVCGTSVAVVGLVDERRLWFKARVGIDVSEWPRAGAFCERILRLEDLEDGSVFEVQDAGLEPGASEHPLGLGPGSYRFCAGAAIRGESGSVLGAVAVLDREPRQLLPQQRQALGTLALQATKLLERRLDNLRLRERDHLLLSILDHLPAVAYAKNIEGRYVFANRFSLEFFKKKSEEVIGWTDMEMLPAEVAEVFLAEDRKVLESGSHRLAEEYSPDGKLAFSTMKFPIRDRHGAIMGIAGIALDISGQRAAEAKLAASAKLASLGEMASGIAHEINNPLAIILTSGTQLRHATQRDSLTPDVAFKIATRIETTAIRIGKIIKGLRAFAREVGGTPMERVSLRQIVEETLEFCRERFRSHEIDLEVAPIPEELSLHCRSVEISQVLLNLLNNAFDAVLGSTGKWVKLEASATGSEVRILVTDGGPGIPPALREKIFQPFFTTKEVGRGTGLGLSLSKGICESHGGSLALDDSVEATRFVVTLPCAGGEASAIIKA